MQVGDIVTLEGPKGYDRAPVCSRESSLKRRSKWLSQSRGRRDHANLPSIHDGKKRSHDFGSTVVRSGLVHTKLPQKETYRTSRPQRLLLGVASHLRLSLLLRRRLLAPELMTIPIPSLSFWRLQLHDSVLTAAIDATDGVVCPWSRVRGSGIDKGSGSQCLA